MDEPGATNRSLCLRIGITLRNTQVFEQVHPLAPDTKDPHIWGPAHEEAYGRTFDELVRQGNLHNPDVKPSFDLVECPEGMGGPRVHPGWDTGTRPN